MICRFADAAEGVEDLARWERQRLELMRWLGTRGHLAPPPDEAYAGWEARLVRVEGASKILQLLIPHEVQIRTFNPQFGPVPLRLPPMRGNWPS